MPSEKSDLVTSETKKKSYTEENPGEKDKNNVPSLQRNVTIVHAVGVIVGSIIGSGIFITPQLIYLDVGSVGAALVMWAITGVYVLLLSWCYMELATQMPASGGEYHYTYNICGPSLGFLVWWMSFAVDQPASSGFVAQTAGLYLATALGMENHPLLCVLIADLIISTCNNTDNYMTRKMLDKSTAWGGVHFLYPP